MMKLPWGLCFPRIKLLKTTGFKLQTWPKNHLRRAPCELPLPLQRPRLCWWPKKKETRHWWWRSDEQKLTRKRWCRWRSKKQLRKIMKWRRWWRSRRRLEQREEKGKVWWLFFFGKKTHLVPRVYLLFDKIIIIIIKH